MNLGPSLLIAALLAATIAVPDARSAKAKRERPSKKGASGPDTCKEPAPVNAELAAGLADYGTSKWADAASHLDAWALQPGADTDPAAARGFYAQSFSLRQLRKDDAARVPSARAMSLLQQRVATSPNLEAYYYLQALHQAAGDTQAHLGVVAKAISEAEAGTLCPVRDADDTFRLARLYEFAGNSTRQAELLREASAAYDRAGVGSQPSPYRGLVARGLGEMALKAGDFAQAETHLRVAAKLDPSIPGIHRNLGLAMLRQGKIAETATYWQENWRLEKQNGNSFMYAVPILRRLAEHQKRFGDAERIANMAEYTDPSLEQNAIAEARAAAEFLARRAEADKSGQAVPPEVMRGIAVADYRMVQFLGEYLRRGQDPQEFAVQNGLIAAILGRGLPAL